MPIIKDVDFKGLIAKYYVIEKIEVIYNFRKIAENTIREGRLIVKIKLYANKGAYQSGKSFLEEKDFVINEIDPEFMANETVEMFEQVEDLLINTHPEFTGGEKEEQET